MLAGERVRVDQARTTRMACPPPIMDQESRFLAALAAVVSFRREGERLLLLDEGGPAARGQPGVDAWLPDGRAA